MVIFYNFERFSLPTSLIKKNTKQLGMLLHVTPFFCSSNISHPLTCKKLGEKDPTDKNTNKWPFFITLNSPPCQSWSQNKTKTIGCVTIYGTLIVSCNSNMSHSFTCLKVWGKVPKQLKILKNDQFHNFEHSYLQRHS